MIFLNFKTYPEASNQNAIKLCQLIKNISSSVEIIPCLQTSDVKPVAQVVDIPIWVQHLDPVELNRPINSISGTLLNHSNRPINFKTISQTLTLCHHHQLKVMIITDTLKMIQKATKLNPDYLGFEDPKLIGGPIPMVQAHPDLIVKAAKLSNQPLIIGGGIRSTNDVKKALKLGAKGILIASEFAKSSNPETTLKELITGFE